MVQVPVALYNRTMVITSREVLRRDDRRLHPVVYRLVALVSNVGGILDAVGPNGSNASWVHTVVKSVWQVEITVAT